MSSCAGGGCRRSRGGSGQAAQARMGCWQWQQVPAGHMAQPLGSHKPGDTVEKGSELCGPVCVLVCAVLPALTPELTPGLTPGLSRARQGLPQHSHAFEDLVGHQTLESRLASPRGDWVTRNAWDDPRRDGEPGSLALNEQRTSLRGHPWVAW